MIEFDIPENLKPLIDVEMRFIQCQANIALWTRLWHICPSQDIAAALAFFIAERKMLQEAFTALRPLLVLN
jgi:hypothetical protein